MSGGRAPLGLTARDYREAPRYDRCDDATVFSVLYKLTFDSLKTRFHPNELRKMANYLLT